MPAIGFRPQYVPLILSGEKDQTIRRQRRRPILPGDRLYFYTGMRTPQCQAIGTAVCHETLQLWISREGIFRWWSGVGVGHVLRHRELIEFARRDGFGTVADLHGVLASMNELPAVFDVIRWTAFTPDESRLTAGR